MKGILIYQPTSKSAPLADFIDGLDPRLREKILLRLYFLTQLEKPEMKEPHFKRFSIERYRDLWELRVKSKVLIRIIFCTLPNGDVLLLHGFVKRQKRDTMQALEQSTTAEYIGDVTHEGVESVTYASFRGRSAITGTIIGVDLYARYLPRSEARMLENKRELCAVVVPYRIPILIRESEMWELGEERPDFVLRNMVGASIDVIVTKVERTANRAQASRRQASRSQRRFFAAREDPHAVSSRITCRMLAVGPRRCLVDCYGYDLDMTQKEIRYAAIPDLRTEFHPGSEIDCIVKEYHPRTGELIVSAKETEVNPFFGAEERHPVGSRRFAMISGKYGGGVFCNLPDGVTCMCNYSYQHEDADFMVGEHVMLMVQRYDQEKLQMYGKIMSKW